MHPEWQVSNTATLCYFFLKLLVIGLLKFNEHNLRTSQSTGTQWSKNGSYAGFSKFQQHKQLHSSEIKWVTKQTLFFPGLWVLFWLKKVKNSKINFQPLTLLTLELLLFLLFFSDFDGGGEQRFTVSQFIDSEQLCQYFPKPMLSHYLWKSQHLAKEVCDGYWDVRSVDCRR